MLLANPLCNKDDLAITKKKDSFHQYIVTLSIDNKLYTFILSENHPFKPPKLLINRRTPNFCYSFNAKFKDALKKYTGVDCFCCESILCDNNWVAQFTLKDIVADVDRFRRAIRRVIDDIIVQVIKRKYLIDDIPIMEWLY